MLLCVLTAGAVAMYIYGFVLLNSETIDGMAKREEAIIHKIERSLTQTNEPTKLRNIGHSLAWSRIQS